VPARVLFNLNFKQRTMFFLSDEKVVHLTGQSGPVLLTLKVNLQESWGIICRTCD
jgi:hypothetical protein